MKLIITRPIEDSKRMSSYFESRGFECIINPLLEISYQKRNKDFDSYNSVILTSRHAVRSLIDKDKTFAKKTVYACGASTYKEAKIFAPDNEYVFYETVSDFVDKYKSTLHSISGKTLYLRGRDVSVDVKSIFKGTNIKIDDHIEYTADEKIFFSASALEEINNSEQAHVLIYSVRTANAFIKAIKKYNLSNKTSIIMSYCISTNIADVLQAAGIKSKILASPAEDAILDLI